MNIDNSNISKQSLLDLFKSKVIDPLFSKGEKNNIQNYADTLLVNQDGKLLVLLRCNSDDFEPGKWSLPGGKIEKDESPLAGAIRELTEETNIDVEELEEYKIVVKDNCVINYFIGSVDTDDINIILDTNEHQGYEWIDINDIPLKTFLLDLGEFLKESFNVQEKEIVEIVADVSDGRDDFLRPQILHVEILSKAEQIQKSMDVLKNAFDEDKIDDATYLDYKNKLNIIKSDFDNQFETRGEGADTWRMKIIKADIGEDLSAQFSDYLSNAFYYNGFIYDNEGLRVPLTSQQVQDALTNYPSIYKVDNDQLDDFDSNKKVLDGLPRKRFQQVLPVIEEYDGLYSTFEEVLSNQFDNEQTDIKGRVKTLKKAIKNTFEGAALNEDLTSLLSFITDNVNTNIDPLLEITIEGGEKPEKKQVFVTELKELLNDLDPTDYLGITNLVIVDLSKYSESDLNIKYYEPDTEINIQTIHNKVKGKLEKKKEDLIDLKKSWDAGDISDEEYFDLSKSKRYELVKVIRGGNIFYQNRLIGTDKIEEELPESESFADDKTGLEVKRYSDKSILITGNTYQNIDLLRKIKTDVGYGTWNKSLNGWVYPYFAKDKVFAALAEKMDVSTYDETVEKENALAAKNALNPGTEVTYEDAKALIEQVIAENGGIEYFIAEADKEVVKQKKEAAAKEQEVEDSAKEEPDATDEDKEKQKRGRKSVPVGTISDDGKRVKTADGWEYIKIKKKEKDIGILAANETKTEELLQHVDESNRFQTGKELFGKEEGEMSVSEKQEEEVVNKEPVIQEIIAPTGVKIQAVTYPTLLDIDVQLIKVENVLGKEKPYWCPDISEYKFSRSGFTLDYIQVEDDKFLVALNGFSGSSLDNKEKPEYAAVTLSQLVGIGEYYKNKAKAELKEKYDKDLESVIERYNNYDEQQLNSYFRHYNLSKKQQAKYTKEQWEALPKEEKMKEFAASNHSSKPAQRRLKILGDNKMLYSNFDMYKKFVNAEYQKPRMLTSLDICYQLFKQSRIDLEQKVKDMEIQREENDSSYEKGWQTSYGDSNTKDDLLESHGVKVKTQNGSEISLDQINQIKNELDGVYKTFGDRSSMASTFGLKISHASDKKMFARKAVGLYVPSMRAIGVSDNGDLNFGFTLAHEFAHFVDNYLGKKGGRYFASDDFNSTAGKIASVFRKNMNKTSDSVYINRTCECFARALEQYHAMSTEGDEALRFHDSKYHESNEQVNKDKFNTLVKPLIEQFFTENNDLLKAITNDIQKSTDEPFEEDNSVEGVAKKDNAVEEESKMTEKELKDWAKNTPLEELEKFIKLSDKENLRKIAHKELSRREKEEHVQDKPIKKAENPFLLG